MTRWFENSLVIGVRSIIFHLLSVLVTAIFMLFLPLILAPRSVSWFFIKLFVWTQIWLLRVICGQTYRLIVDADPGPGPNIFASRHEALWETMFLPVLLDNPVVFLKQEILSYPVAGVLSRKLQYIGLDRSGAVDRVREAFGTARLRAKEGRSFLIFPSGTRNPDKRYNVEKGVAVLYRALKLPVVPVVLDSGTYWPYKNWRRRPGVITIRILPAIDSGMRTSEFLEHLAQDLARPA